MELDRCNGPECPACGCTDTRILQRPASPEPGKASWWASGRARCNYCGNRFAFRELPGPAAPPIATPTPPPITTPDPAPLSLRGISSRRAANL